MKESLTSCGIAITNMEEFATNITSNFTVYLLSFKDLEIKDKAQIQGARIGICAQNITTNETALITSDSLGCASLHGPGTVFVDNPKCSSPGASYGDRGGHATDRNATQRRVSNQILSK